MNLEELTGQIFGNLTVIGKDSNKTDRVYWKCSCVCGGTNSVRAAHLKTGKIASCGGIIHRLGKNNNSWRGFEDIGAKQWNRLLRSAKERNLIVEIDIKYLWELFILQDKKCALTRLPLSLIGIGGGNGTASVDRIDSLKGYTKENTQWIHKDVNKMKNNFTEKRFIEICKLVSKNS